jgi:hypothetical protein
MKNNLVKYWVYPSLPNKSLVYIFILMLTLSSCGISRHATLPVISSQPVVREFEPPAGSRVDTLMAKYGNKKLFVEEFKEPALIALSYYPELKDVNIDFKYSDEATTMAARPSPLSLFSSERKYLILINNSRDFEGILLEDVPFNAQIGIIGHELAHIADYNNHNLWGIAGIYFRYLDIQRRALFEKEIDKATIERGLGWQLYDWATYSILANNGSSDDYRVFKEETYMHPERIEQVISYISKYEGSDSSISRSVASE